MAKREKLEEGAPNNYFAAPKEHYKFVSSGCTLLDCALGGGFVLGRVANIVGDKSTAKTALASEIITNFLLTHPKGIAAYRDTEAAFDEEYAHAMGMPVDNVDFGDRLVTVERFAQDINGFLDKCKDNPGVYVVDSLDALSDAAEMDRALGEASYGMAKPKLMGEFFRKTVDRVEDSNVLLLIVSQVRENIGVTFGEKYRRSGGKALDFYASQILWLAHTATLKRTIKKVERSYGVSIKAKVKKNKVGLPFREAEFDFVFGYGIDDVSASVNWLKKVDRLGEAGISDPKKFLADLDDLPPYEYTGGCQKLAATVKQVWAEIETSFLPKRRKYAS